MPQSTYQDPVDVPAAAALPVASSTGGQFGERTITLSETLNPKTLRDIVDSVKGVRRAKAQVLVFRGDGTSPHFCTGMDLKAATFGDDTMSQGLEEFARLHQVWVPAFFAGFDISDKELRGSCQGEGTQNPPQKGRILLSGGFRRKFLHFLASFCLKRTWTPGHLDRATVWVPA